MNKKKFLIGLIFIIMCVIVWFCFNSSKEKEIEKPEKPLENVTMVIKDGTLTKTGATIVLNNGSDITIYYGNPYHIEKKVDDTWHILNTINDLSFTMPLYSLEPKKTKEIEINWEYGYGELKSGTYRIVKEIDIEKENGKFDSFSVRAEFTID